MTKTKLHTKLENARKGREQILEVLDNDTNPMVQLMGKVALRFADKIIARAERKAA